jgi:hypothetical protein
MAEVVGKLTGKLDGKTVLASAEEERRRGGLRPNRDRLTVGVDLGDQWSGYCILGLEGETLAEEQLRTTSELINTTRGLVKSMGARYPNVRARASCKR